ncbi:MAG TPA: response regulator [Aggregatilineaceae bacterium]|jgi:CheY-like chemotaxis protein|nr:response regulator [Aggregatilineaceae bacterium]
MTSDQLALVIEDDAEIARFFALVLKDVGFTVESLHNGRAALARLAEIVPRLVLLDMNMPSVSGVEILNRIRADARLEDVPVIVITANPQMVDHVYDLADLVLNKPVSYDQLRDLSRRFV